MTAMNMQARVFGQTSGGWVIKNPPSRTNRAEYGFLLERGTQKSILEKAKNHWRYMIDFDTTVSPPVLSRDSYLLSIKGTNVCRSDSLQDALVALGLSRDDAIEAIKIIAAAVP